MRRADVSVSRCMQCQQRGMPGAVVEEVAEVGSFSVRVLALRIAVFFRFWTFKDSLRPPAIGEQLALFGYEKTDGSWRGPLAIAQPTAVGGPPLVLGA